MDGQRLMIVNDDPASRKLIAAHLRASGFEVAAVGCVEHALTLLCAERFAVLVTSLLLRRLDSVALIGVARALDPDLEVIVLMGAVGAHPVRLSDLGVQIAAALTRRRSRLERVPQHREARLVRDKAFQEYLAGPEADSSAYLRLGHLELDVRRRRAALGSRALPLSHSEFDLLLYLAHRQNRVISAQEIAREVLDYSPCTPAEAREIVKVRIHRLRRKLEFFPEAFGMLINVRGAGYMLTAGWQPPPAPLAPSA